MKKISILFITTILMLVVAHLETTAQTTASVKKNVTESNQNFMEWFNNGRLDSLMTLYADNACLEGRGCGKDFVKEYYKVEASQYKIRELVTSEITVKDKTAIETGRWKIELPSGVVLTGGYRSEWQLMNKKWMIVKEAMPMADQ